MSAELFESCFLRVFRGYVGDEAATRNTFVGEWLRTGDIMMRDENDNFWVTDRLKEVSMEFAVDGLHAKSILR